MNTYNFQQNGCVFYHAIASSEERAIELAINAGYDIEDLEIELERENVRDELGIPYKEGIQALQVTLPVTRHRCTSPPLHSLHPLAPR